MLDVLLIIPPSAFLLDERVFPSLGILKVASALLIAGRSVQVLDLSGVTDYVRVARETCHAMQPRFVGFTATSPQLPAVYKIVPGIDRPTILGGPHATLVHAAAIKETVPGRSAQALAALCGLFTYVVAGDGEEAIARIVSGQAHPGIINADDPTKPLFLSKKRVAESQTDRSLIDLGSYHYKIDGVEATSLIAQLGCPFGCRFCGGRASPMLRRARNRPPISAVDELKTLHKTYGYRGFMFYDDELNISESNLLELMDGIAHLARDLGTEFRLRGFVKAELFTDTQARAMYAAGFRWLLTGFESGDSRILHNINKRATIEDNTRCVEIARNAGLKVKALMSVGHPGESPETISNTRRWLLEMRPEDLDVTVITPYPGCPYYDDAMHIGPGHWTYACPDNGDKLHMNEVDYTKTADYYKGIPGEYRAYVWTDTLSSEELVQERDRLEKEVRTNLGLPLIAVPTLEHSMGQSV